MYVNDHLDRKIKLYQNHKVSKTSSQSLNPYPGPRIAPRCFLQHIPGVPVSEVYTEGIAQHVVSSAQLSSPGSRGLIHRAEFSNSAFMFVPTQDPMVRIYHNSFNLLSRPAFGTFSCDIAVTFLVRVFWSKHVCIHVGYAPRSGILVRKGERPVRLARTCGALGPVRTPTGKGGRPVAPAPSRLVFLTLSHPEEVIVCVSLGFSFPVLWLMLLSTFFFICLLAI